MSSLHGGSLVYTLTVPLIIKYSVDRCIFWTPCWTHIDKMNKKLLCKFLAFWCTLQVSRVTYIHNHNHRNHIFRKIFLQHSTYITLVWLKRWFILRPVPFCWYRLCVCSTTCFSCLKFGAVVRMNRSFQWYTTHIKVREYLSIWRFSSYVQCTQRHETQQMCNLHIIQTGTFYTALKNMNNT